MKKVIASILSLAFLSGLFVNSSFAEEIQTAEIAQEKASNAQLDQTELKAQEKSAEKLKNDLKKYNEKQQKLIQKYENMTDKEFIWDKIKKTFMKILGAFAGLQIVSAFVGLGYYMATKRYDELLEYWKKLKYDIGYQEGLIEGEVTGRRDGYQRGLRDGKIFLEDCGLKTLIKKLLATLHPDYFPQKAKSFSDVKELYYNATNFYNTYLK